eukprot:UN10978
MIKNLMSLLISIKYQKYSSLACVKSKQTFMNDFMFQNK